MRGDPLLHTYTFVGLPLKANFFFNEKCERLSGFGGDAEGVLLDDGSAEGGVVDGEVVSSGGVAGVGGGCGWWWCWEV